MTATFDATTDARFGGPLASMGGPRNLGRFAWRTLGAALVVAGIGVWLEPTAYPGPDLVAMKLGLSLFLSLAGFLILQERTDRDDRTGAGPALHIDTVRREVRVITRTGRGADVARRIPLRDLGQADLDGDMLHLRDAQGAPLGTVSLADPQIRARLCAVLQDAGRL